MQEYRTLFGDIIDMRELAILFQSRDMDNPVWIPKSQIRYDDILEIEDKVDIEVTEWFCEQNEIE
jgi:hypothetical protein